MHVTARRIFLAGGVGGVAIQVGTCTSRCSASASERSLGVLVCRISPVFIVDVGVQTGDALIEGMGRKPQIVSLWSLEDGEWRKARRSRRDPEEVMVAKAERGRVQKSGKFVALFLTRSNELGGLSPIAFCILVHI